MADSTYTVVKAFPMQGQACHVGDILTLHPRQAKWYLLDGRIALVEAPAKKKTDAPKPTATDAPSKAEG